MKTILVVEDEYAIMDALAALLQDEGYRVLTAAHGKEALEVMSRDKPDVVLLDLMMPVMDGMTALQAIRADPQLRDVPVIVMSAASSRLNPASGASSRILKPFHVGVLLDEIRKQLKDGA
ncbi:MAG: response regulator [Myxococcota bacterium]